MLILRAGRDKCTHLRKRNAVLSIAPESQLSSNPLLIIPSNTSPRVIPYQHHTTQHPVRHPGGGAKQHHRIGIAEGKPATHSTAGQQPVNSSAATTHPFHQFFSPVVFTGPDVSTLLQDLSDLEICLSIPRLAISCTGRLDLCVGLSADSIIHLGIPGWLFQHGQYPSF